MLLDSCNNHTDQPTGPASRTAHLPPHSRAGSRPPPRPAPTIVSISSHSLPRPLPVRRQLCPSVDEEAAGAEALWHSAERQRFLNRGYPEALAEFWVLCAREGYTEKRLLALGLSTATARRLRYLEMPPWPNV